MLVLKVRVMATNAVAINSMVIAIVRVMSRPMVRSML